MNTKDFKNYFEYVKSTVELINDDGWKLESLYEHLEDAYNGVKDTNLKYLNRVVIQNILKKDLYKNTVELLYADSKIRAILEYDGYDVDELTENQTEKIYNYVVDNLEYDLDVYYTQDAYSKLGNLINEATNGNCYIYEFVD